jgi:hypothetical protein
MEEILLDQFAKGIFPTSADAFYEGILAKEPAGLSYANFKTRDEFLNYRRKRDRSMIERLQSKYADKWAAYIENNQK